MTDTFDQDRQTRWGEITLSFQVETEFKEAQSWGKTMQFPHHDECGEHVSEWAEHQSRSRLLRDMGRASAINRKIAAFLRMMGRRRWGTRGFMPGERE